MSESRDTVAGAVGLPIAIVAAALALVPPFVFYVAWIPGVVALALGIVGLLRSRGRGPTGLSWAAIVVAGASFLITLLWLALAGLISTFVECLAPTCL